MSSRKKQEIEEDLEFLRQRFDDVNSAIKLPHSLSADMLRYKLENLEVDTEVFRKNIRWKPIMGVAACFVVGFVSIFAMQSASGSRVGQSLSSDGAIEMAAAPAAVESGESGASGEYAAIRDTVFELNGGMYAYSDLSGDVDAAAADETLMSAAAPQTADGAVAAPAAAPQTADGAVAAPAAAPQTADGAVAAPAAVPQMDAMSKGRSVQPSGFALAGENEAENTNGMLEVSGEYLYSYVEENGNPIMYISKAGDKKPSAQIELTSRVNAFFVNENHLVTVGDGKSIPDEAMPGETIVGSTDDSLYSKLSTKEYQFGGGFNTGMTSEATFYDLSDKAQPRLIKAFTQDGQYVDSCIRDNMFYFVTSRSVWPSFSGKDVPMSELVPVTRDSEQAKASIVPAKNITTAKGAINASYAIVSALELSTGAAETYAVLGGGYSGSTVYFSDDDIYVYCDVASGSNTVYNNTGIIRLGMDGKKLVMTGQGTVPGYVIPSAFGESDGNLTVVSTTGNDNTATVNEVTVFDTSLKKIGGVDGIAKGEAVTGVHYAGDMAYLAMSGETDAADNYVVDLTVTASPKLLGGIKLTGTRPHEVKTVDDSTLIVMLPLANANGIPTGITKLSLFDMSAPMDPRELYSEMISDEPDFFSADSLLFDGKSNVAVAGTRSDNSGVNRMEYKVYSISRDGGIKQLGSVDDAYSGRFGSDGTLYLQKSDCVIAYSCKSALTSKNETFYSNSKNN